MARGKQAMSNLEWLITFFGIPILIFTLLDHTIFLRHKKIFLKIFLGSFIFAYPWDLLAVAHRSWTFPQGLLGIHLLGLPLEQYLWGMMFATIIVYFTLYLLKTHDK